MLTHLPTRPRTTIHVSSRIAIVASSYHPELVEPMVEKALQEIHAIDTLIKTEVVHAPGSFEIPYLARQMIEKRKSDAVICLGVILQGETGHAELIAASVSHALCQLSVEAKTPIIHGVLFLKNEEQAKERCLGEEYNRGIEAARAAVESLRASRAILPLPVR